MSLQSLCLAVFQERKNSSTLGHLIIYQVRAKRKVRKLESWTKYVTILQWSADDVG